MWDKKDAVNIYDELRAISARILPMIGCKPEPWEYDGVGRTRTNKWKLHDGKRTYRGVLYHYTNGVSMERSARWANDPRYGNKGSSWHAQIDDRLAGKLGDEWMKNDDEILILFPVPTLIMADHRWGTWHGNWSCDVCLGVENRNCGYSGYSKLKGGLKALNKVGYTTEFSGRKWEEYSLDQLVCNINYGRMVSGMNDGDMDKDLILTHQNVWATKNDCGPMFPIHVIRDAIFTEESPEDVIRGCVTPFAPTGFCDSSNDSLDDDSLNNRSNRSMLGMSSAIKDDVPEHGAGAKPIMLLSELGYHIVDDKSLVRAIRFFQKSSVAYKYHDHPEKVLDETGVLDKKTKDILGYRHRAHFGH